MNKPTMACIVGLAAATACAPDTELTAAPAAELAQASLYVAAPTCGPAKVTALPALLPDAKIDGIMEVDFQHLRRGAMFGEVERLLATEAAEVVGAMKECSVPLSAAQGVVVGFNESGDVVLAAKATGLGTPGTLDCLAKKLEAASGKAPWKRTTSGCTTTLDMSGGDDKGFVVDKDTVVFASKSMVPAVSDRIAGKGKAALDGRLGWARGKVDMKGTAWAASNIPASAGTGMSPALAGMSRVTMSIDASKGLGLAVGAGFKSSSSAKSAADELNKQVVQAKAMLPLLGLSSKVGDSIEVKAKGSLVSMAMFLSRDDLDTIRKAVGSMSGGSGSSPPPSPSGI
ncbi:MAG: hypothetical protein K0V04_29760 [Deltaproteobacteria bacterium]|nr:hypothetical protein [Deltaproteobacteria bacterium]